MVATHYSIMRLFLSQHYCRVCFSDDAKLFKGVPEAHLRVVGTPDVVHLLQPLEAVDVGASHVRKLGLLEASQGSSCGKMAATCEGTLPATAILLPLPSRWCFGHSDCNLCRKYNFRPVNTGR